MPRRKKGLDSGGGRGSGKSSIVLNSKGKPQQRNAANARERARMRVLSRAFCRLKTTLPWVPADTKLSKLDTLRLAASYIAHLKGILRDDSFSSSDETASHPAMSLTWPFGFNRPTTISGGNGSSIGGGSEADESVEGSSSCWEPDPESPTKDCIHLDHSDQTDLLASAIPMGKHLQMHFDETRSDLHGKLDDLPNSGISTNLLNNNHIISYNYHQEHQHHNLQNHPSSNPSSVPYGFQQSDMILSIS